jgi:crotonobetainyl-CoA:carnitine CoA-transferase CaiB-like acyl-CoA transferase
MLRRPVKIQVHQRSDGPWLVFYVDRTNEWRLACDALGRPILCETRQLAASVAAYRRRRLQPLER